MRARSRSKFIFHRAGFLNCGLLCAAQINKLQYVRTRSVVKFYRYLRYKAGHLSVFTLLHVNDFNLQNIYSFNSKETRPRARSAQYPLKMCNIYSTPAPTGHTALARAKFKNTDGTFSLSNTSTQRAGPFPARMRSGFHCPATGASSGNPIVVESSGNTANSSIYKARR